MAYLTGEEIIFLQNNPMSVTLKHPVDNTIAISDNKQLIQYSYYFDYWFLSVPASDNNPEYNNTLKYQTTPLSLSQAGTVEIGENGNKYVTNVLKITIPPLNYDALMQLHIRIKDDSGSLNSNYYDSQKFVGLYNNGIDFNINSINWARSKVQISG